MGQQFIGCQAIGFASRASCCLVLNRRVLHKGLIEQDATGFKALNNCWNDVSIEVPVNIDQVKTRFSEGLRRYFKAVLR